MNILNEIKKALIGKRLKVSVRVDGWTGTVITGTIKEVYGYQNSITIWWMDKERREVHLNLYPNTNYEYYQPSTKGRKK